MARHITSAWASSLLTLCVQAQSPNIVGYEYWFDQNHTAPTQVAVTPGTTVDLDNVTLNTTGLSLGQHVVHLRWKDQPAAGQARWSSVVTRGFQVGQPGPWEIIAVRYWIGSPANDADPLVRYKYFETPQAVLNYNNWLELCGYDNGPQTLRLQLLDNHGQWSSVVTRSLTVNPAGTLGAPTITASASTFCPGDEITFTATPQIGPGFTTPTGFEWQIPTDTGWSATSPSENSITVTIGESSGTVQAWATNYCGSSAAGSYPVVIPAVPNQPGPMTGPLQACIGSDATYGIPQVPGMTYMWEIDPWSGEGTGPTISTVIGSTDATISVTPYNACGVPGLPRVENIIVTAPPDAGGDGTFAICSDDLPVNLFTLLQGTPDSGGVWRFDGMVVSNIYNPATATPGAYTYTVQGTGPCPNDVATVQVSEPQVPNAGLDATLTLCSNAPAVDMSTQLGGSPDAGGTWSGPSWSDGVYDPMSMEPGIYTYLVTGVSPCPNASATLTITEDPAPNAGTGGLLALCENALPETLMQHIVGEPAQNGTWYGPNGQPTVGIFLPGTDEEGEYVYVVAGEGSCGADSAFLAVNVMDLEIDSIMGDTIIFGPGHLVYSISPFLTDADSVAWVLPPGWDWDGDADHYDQVAEVFVDAAMSSGLICATAYGGVCSGVMQCIPFATTAGSALSMDDGLNIEVFPNPNDGRFTIRIAKPSETIRVRMLSALGEQVNAFTLNPTSTHVDLEDVSSGTYVLHWTNETRSGSWRVIVAH